MERSTDKTSQENDATQPSEEIFDFDEDTLKGEQRR